MKLIDACEKAKKHLVESGYMPCITEIVDIGDRWLFFGQLDDEDGYDYGNNPVAVTKKGGKTEDFYLGDIENYLLYDKGIDVEIPNEYQNVA